ncbi:caspase family protein, partial [Paracoccus binzhouensis]|uniref:caspase family protein n=1 Tax=Paracoccus binzhouensis TaxID=2796149 RepID=UPI0018EF0D13
MRIAAVCLAVLAGAESAWAEDRAVIIGNADYQSAPDLAGSDTAALAGALREAGFITQDGVDQPAGALRRTVEALARAEDRPGARIVVLNGRFLHDAGETWFMGTDAGEPGALAVGRQGVALSLLIRLMAGGKPGSVLILGTDGQQMPHRPGLENGIGLTEAPAGVSVITGTPEASARALAELLRGHSLGQAVTADPALRLLPGSAADLALLDRGGRPAPDPQAAERTA